MKLEDAIRLANELMREHLARRVVLADGRISERRLMSWSFGFDRATSRFGLCNHTNRKITISKTLTELNDESEVRDTILHEIAHALAGWEAGHGPKWKAEARRIGARPERCYSSERVSTTFKYIGHCSHDGCAGNRRNRLTSKARRGYCGKCIERSGHVWDNGLPSEIESTFKINWKRAT